MKMEQKPLLKQGWLRALLYFIALFISLIGISLLAGVIIALLPIEQKNLGTTTTIGFAVNYLPFTISALIITFLFTRFINKVSFASLGFARKGFENESWTGFFTGPALLGLGTIVLALSGYLTFIDLSFNATEIFSILVMMIIVSFTEELVFRGYILNNLLQSTNKWIALTISSVAFGIIHLTNPSISVLALVNIVAAGFLLGINYIYTKNLWFGIFFHFSWNFFQGAVFGYEVSGLEVQSIFQQTLSGPELFTGGEFGFEGSLLCAVLIILATIFYAVVFSKKYKEQVQLQ